MITQLIDGIKANPVFAAILFVIFLIFIGALALTERAKG